MSKKVINNSLEKNQFPVAAIVFVTLLMAGSLVFLWTRIKTEEERTNITWLDYAANEFKAGTGTEDDPFLISNPEELALLAKRVNAGVDNESLFYKLSNDIDLSGSDWMPIGSTKAFKGNFNGAGHTIMCMKLVPKKKVNYYGLFGLNTGYIANVEVKNITSDLDFTGMFKRWLPGEEIYLGCFVGKNKGNIENIQTRGTLKVTVEDYVTVGSFAGANAGGSIKNAKSEVSLILIDNPKGYLGGFVGETLDESVMDGCVYRGSLTIFSPQESTTAVGGFVGRTKDDKASFYECLAATEIAAGSNLTSEQPVAGFVGIDNGSRYEACLCRAYSKISGNRKFLSFANEEGLNAERYGYYLNKTTLLYEDTTKYGLKDFIKRKRFFKKTMNLSEKWVIDKKTFFPRLKLVME